MKELTLKQKISQMFIVGFRGENYSSNKYFMQFLENGLGGVIFFSHNIKSTNQFKELISSLKTKSKYEMFFSIDQEGGNVERTENIHGGKKYLSANAAYKMGLSFLQNQTKEIALEIKSYGINMNFAPVLDVNTNPNNPIIGTRAFSSKTEEVSEAMKVVLKEYKRFGIIATGKHFPGHGASVSDSHKTLPIIDVNIEDLNRIHINPFKQAIEMEIPAIMAAHAAYPAIDKENIPASLSSKIITDILRKELNFKGLIITDDMEMNGVKGFSRIEACIKAINAGVDMFIYRDASKEVFELIENIENAIKEGIISEEQINAAVNRILGIKYQYGIIH